jgi:hypothetical protein
VRRHDRTAGVLNVHAAGLWAEVVPQALRSSDVQCP